MSKRRFTEAQIAELSKNKNIFRCSEKSITFNKEFKVWAVKQYYESGYSPMMIFAKSDINLTIIGKKTPEECLRRWRKTYKAKGTNGLISEARGKSKSGGRPKKNGLTDAEKIKRMEVEIAYLKAENDFLAKLRAAKKR